MANPGNPVSAQARDAEANVDTHDEVVMTHYSKVRIDTLTDLMNPFEDDINEYIVWVLNEPGRCDWDDCWGHPGDVTYEWTEQEWDETGTGTASGGFARGSDACGQKDPSDPSPYTVQTDWPDTDACHVSATRQEIYNCDVCVRHRERHGFIRYELHTGGKAAIQRENLFALNGWASGVGNAFYPEVDIDAQSYIIPYTSVKLGTLGYLGSDAFLYKALPDNKTYDVTPIVAGSPYYRYGPPGKQKYVP